MGSELSEARGLHAKKHRLQIYFRSKTGRVRCNGTGAIVQRAAMSDRVFADGKAGTGGQAVPRENSAKKPIPQSLYSGISNQRITTRSRGGLLNYVRVTIPKIATFRAYAVHVLPGNCGKLPCRGPLLCRRPAGTEGLISPAPTE